MFSHSKGFTLIEIIVAMAIFFLVTMVFVTLFSFSVGEIFGAGDKSESIFDAQGRVEKAIESDDPSAEEGVTSEEKDIVVEFPDQEDIEEVKVPGELLEVEYEYNEYTSYITHFLPEEKE